VIARWGWRAAFDQRATVIAERLTFWRLSSSNAGVSMSNKRRVAEDNAGVFLSDRGAIVTPIHGLNVGPGEPGPGDEWRVPTGPIEAVDDASLGPVDSNETAVLPPHPTNKR